MRPSSPASPVTALKMASQERYLDAIKDLAGEGGDATDDRAINGCTALMLAALEGHPYVVATAQSRSRSPRSGRCEVSFCQCHGRINLSVPRPHQSALAANAVLPCRTRIWGDLHRGLHIILHLCAVLQPAGCATPRSGSAMRIMVMTMLVIMVVLMMNI